MTAEHEYRIAVSDPAAHLFEVSVTVESPDPTGQVFRFPAWIPGSYMIRDLARNVVSISATSDGREVGLTKLDKSTWQAGPCDAPLTVRAEIFAFDLNVRDSHPNTPWPTAYIPNPGRFERDDAAFDMGHTGSKTGFVEGNFSVTLIQKHSDGSYDVKVSLEASEAPSGADVVIYNASTDYLNGKPV